MCTQRCSTGPTTVSDSKCPVQTRSRTFLQDAVGSVSFHPLKAFALSVSGSRHFGPASTEPDQSSDSDDDEAMQTQVSRRHPTAPSPHDSTVKLWNF